MNTGLKLWRKALEVIPGGNGLLSKRPNRYLPDIWPTYFSKAKGVYVWDLDGNDYIDMAQMGIGTAILGYNDDDVNNAIKSAVDAGVGSTLNVPEEVYLAEKLIKLNPFSGGVKFARTGAEAMAIAVRIARSYSGKDKIAFSGYHGWSDWYLAANLTGKSALNDHLLPGLKPKGVPKNLADSIYPFRYNDLRAFTDIMNAHDIGVIIIEGARYDFPSKEFLKTIQSYAKKKSAVIIVDEITSGWRMVDGGVYKILDFHPDIVVYGKAMGNGYAISAIVGKKEIMDEAQETFISSTFWTERIGFSAGLATINKLCVHKIWEHLNSIGKQIGLGWIKIAQKYQLKIHITDFKPLITFKFDYGELNSTLYTIFTQEMLKKGYLAANSVYVSYAHTDDIIGNYLKRVDLVFKIIAQGIEKNTLNDLLETKIRDEGFKRLT